MTQAKHRWFILVCAGLLLIVGSGLAISMGAKELSLQTIYDAIVHFDGSLDHQLIRDVRLPRMISAALTGGLLGICGAMMQSVTRNPIAEPSLLGISQGATLAISVLYCNIAWVTTANTVLASLIGAIISGGCILLFAMRRPSNFSMGKLLLAGTALSTFFLSLATVIGLLTNNSQMIGFLIGGGFRTAQWVHVGLLVFGTAIGLTIAMLLASKFNVISLGDEACIALGERPNRIRLITVLLVLPLCAITVAVAKNIAFVGLIIPQIVGRMMKKDYHQIIPRSFLFGAVLLVFADLLARMLLSPYEIPIGIFTSLLGVPFFLYIVQMERR